MLPSRRHFLQSAVAVSAGFATLRHFVASSSGDSFDLAKERRVQGYGELKPDPAGVLDLPEGFTYRIVSRFGDSMTDGFVVPGRPWSTWSTWSTWEETVQRAGRRHERDHGYPFEVPATWRQVS